MTTFRLQRNPHDYKLQNSWKLCREGLRLFRLSESNRQDVLQWTKRMSLKTGISYYGNWLEILEDDSGLQEEISRDFFDLPQERQNFWSSLIQTMPFVPVLRKSQQG